MMYVIERYSKYIFKKKTMLLYDENVSRKHHPFMGRSVNEKV